ncbi:HAD family hydrolase [Ancylobacter sonchi]|nr:HAD family hydrolase [Ancylobacter sonchi]
MPIPRKSVHPTYRETARPTILSAIGIGSGRHRCHKARGGPPTRAPGRRGVIENGRRHVSKGDDGLHPEGLHRDGLHRSADIRPQAIIFDFDGVILDSARLKTQAFADCYAGEAEETIAEVVAYQDRHGGVGRREKFAHYERELFGRPGDPAALDALCRRFAELIDTAMMEAPFIPGAVQVLAALHGCLPLHLVSGMPETELRVLLARRGLDGFFASVAGTPRLKLPEFRRILADENLAPGEVLAVGDARTEFDAAMELGIPFLAIVAEGAPDFFPADVPRHRDLSGFLDFVAR